MAGKKDYDRYEIYRNDDSTIDQLPFVKISNRGSDKFERWNSIGDRYDKYAKRYYRNPFFDFLITYANPQYLSEFDIPDGAVVRIPFPLKAVREEYENKLKNLRNR